MYLHDVLRVGAGFATDEIMFPVPGEDRRLSNKQEVLVPRFGQPGEAARDVLNFVSPIPDFYLLDTRVVRVGGLPRSVIELPSVAPAMWKVRLGEARLEFPREPESLLHRLGMGRPLAAFWGQMRYRFTITPR